MRLTAEQATRSRVIERFMRLCDLPIECVHPVEGSKTAVFWNDDDEDTLTLDEAFKVLDDAIYAINKRDMNVYALIDIMPETATITIMETPPHSSIYQDEEFMQLFFCERYNGQFQSNLITR